MRRRDESLRRQDDLVAGPDARNVGVAYINARNTLEIANPKNTRNLKSVRRRVSAELLSPLDKPSVGLA